MNTSTIILTIGSAGVLGYVFNTQFTRKKVQDNKVEEFDESKMSKL